MKDGRYFVKPWKLMEKEFGVSDNGNINCLKVWTDIMEVQCPKDRIIEVINNEWNKCYISEDMLVGPAFEWGDEIKVSNDGKRWSKQIFYGIISGYEYPYYTIKGYCYKYARPIEKEENDSFDFSVFNDHEIHVKRLVSWLKKELKKE